MAQIGFIDRDSPIHRIHPLLKLFALVVFTTSVLVISDWRLIVLQILIVISGIKVAGIGIRRLVKRLRSLVVFSLLLFILQVLLVRNGTVLIFMVPSIGGSGPLIPVTDYGVERGLNMSLRFVAIVFASIFFVSVTDPTLLSYSFTRIGVSYRHSFMLVLALRFIPLFDLESQTVRMALNARGITSRPRHLSELIQMIRYTLRPLLISAISRIDSLTISMEGRGFGYRPSRTFARAVEWSRLDTTVLFLVLLYCLCCLLYIIGQLAA